MPCCERHPRVMTPQEEQKELEDPLEWLPPGKLPRLSPVASFYDGASVFVTGVTGFVGTLVVEKLLRSCPGVSTVYVLVRDKKGVPLRERLRSHLDKVIFSRVREECPGRLSKVVPIAGDCCQPGLGISAADAAELCSNVTVVFHLAATVRFDADIRTAAITNVGSTYEVMKLIKRMPNLKAFVYMSTAYSNAPRDEIDEKFYPPAMKADELLKLVSVMDDEQLAQLLPLLLGDWPNTYTFTKAIAEDVVRANASGLPVSVIRPSIVLNTYREPLALWVGNMYGPSALTAGAVVGLLHVIHMDGSALVDGIPADMVANATIACAWDTWCRHSKQVVTHLATDQPTVYNLVSTDRHPISWDEIYSIISVPSPYPSIRSIWYPSGYMCKRKFLYIIGAVFLHLIPAILADTYLYLKGMKPMLWNIYSKIHGVSQALEPFTTREWTFREGNLVALLGRLDEADRKLFPCDILDVDWEWMLLNAIRGTRLYILHESFDNLEAARRKYRLLWILHLSLVTISYGLVLFMLWGVVDAMIGL